MGKLSHLKTLPAWLILAFTATLLRFRIDLNSDTLLLDHLFTDLFTQGGRWAEWKFSTAPAFMPDMLLYLLAFPLLPDAASRILAVSVIQVFLLAGALLWCAHQIRPTLSVTGANAILLLLALFTLTSANSRMWLYFYSTNNHLASVLFGLTGVGLILRYLARPQKLSAALLVAGGAFGAVSTGLFMLSFTVPVLLLLGLAWLALGDADGPLREQRRRVLHLAAMVAGAQVLGRLLGKLLVANVAREGKVQTSPETAGTALRNFLQAIKTAFAPDNPLTLACAVLVLLALLLLAWRLLRAAKLGHNGLVIAKPDWRFGAAAAVLAAGMLVHLPGVILSGGFADQYAMRYLAFPFALALLLCVVHGDRTLASAASAGSPSAPTRRRPLAVLAPWGLVVLGTMLVADGARLVLRAPPPFIDASAIAANCLTRIEHAGFPLRAGIASFWNGRGLQYALPHHNPMLVTDNRLAPFFHMATLGPVQRPQDYPGHVYNFAVLYGAAQPVDPEYTAATMRDVLPPPARIEACGDGRLEIWLYQDASLDRAVKQAGAAYLAGRKRR